ncbi:MAG: amidohydrolase family protein [Polaromonas sp.]|nr:amidohydrolase family protein [Polaromonas sp.]
MIDAHFHCWKMGRADYGWLDADLNPALMPICRDVSVSDWQAQSVPHGIAGGVLVQAAATEAETHFLLAQADANAAVLGVVGWVDLLAADAPARIEKLARHPKLKGLRPMLQDLADPDWILKPALAPALQAMLDAGLVFDALVKSVHLPHILTLAGRYPNLVIVIDHAAKPNIAAGEWQPWADGMAQIAKQTQAMCKLSGLMTEAGPDPKLDVLQPYAAHVLQCFGAARLVWGSDWPVLELACSYADWWRYSQQLLDVLDVEERAAVLGGNAQRLYALSGLLR